jgi:uncharacterized secreted protein with C-terminal beta-propeller domain
MILSRAISNFSQVLAKLSRRGYPSVRTLAIIALIASAGAFTSVYVGTSLSGPETLMNFRSHVELILYLQTHQISGPRGLEPAILTFSGDSNTLAYSDTNIQVSGVDEMDLVKTNGTILYFANDEQVHIIRAYPLEMVERIGVIQPEGVPQGLFLFNSTRLTIISQNYSNIFVEVFDVSDPSIPLRISGLVLEGYLVGTRMIQNILYLIIASSVRDYEGRIQLPRVDVLWGEIGRFKYIVPASRIHYDPHMIDSSFQYTNVISLDVLAPSPAFDIQTFLIASSYATLYVSHNNIYLLSHQWHYGDSTKIHRIQIQEGVVAYAASGQVPGQVLNQFSVDEYDRTLRVATTYRNNSRQMNGVFLLDMSLKTIGSIQGLAPNERLYSARFLGPMGFLVTFYKVDPLFVINLTSPTNPQVLGELHIPGFSQYLHPLDSTHLLGIGKDVKFNEVTWWYQGLKLSLFNTTNPFEPQEMTKLIIGARGTTSEALQDHKAVLIDPEMNLLSIPIQLYEHVYNTTNIDPWEHGTAVWQGAYVFHIDYENPTLIIRGEITHITDLSQYQDNPWNFRHQFIKRIGYIGSVFYAISDYKISFHNLTDLELIATISLPLLTE